MISFLAHKISFFKRAAIIGCLFIWGCENDPEEIKAWTEKKVMVEEAKDIVSLFSQQGTLKAKLTAPVMLRYEADTVIVEFPKTLHVKFYDTTTKVESELDAKYGKYFESQNKVLLKDSVLVFNINGDTLRTSELWWDQAKQKFYTDKQVRLKTIDKQIYGGRGMEAEQDLSGWSIFEPTGTVVMPEEMTVTPN